MYSAQGNLNDTTIDMNCLCRTQEPDTEANILLFAQGFGVEFDMFSKVIVNGSNAIPLYKYLKSQLKGTLGR